MAQISHRDQMVVFGDCQSSMDRHRQCQLEEQLNECMKLQDRLGKANEQLALDPRYVQKVTSIDTIFDCACFVFAEYIRWRSRGRPTHRGPSYVMTLLI